MNPSWTPADVTRLLDLIATPLAVEILDGLGHGRIPENVTPAGTSPETIATAVSRLRDIDAVSDPTEGQPYQLTSRGCRLLAALERVCEASERSQTPDSTDTRPQID